MKHQTFLVPLIVAALLLGPTITLATGDCNDFIDLSGGELPIVVSGSTVGASADYGPFSEQPACWQGTWNPVCAQGSDVTYKWAAPYSGRFTFQIFDSDYNDNLLIYHFTCPVEPVYPDDFICGSHLGIGSHGIVANVELTINQEILIVVDSYYTQSGQFDLWIYDALQVEKEPYLLFSGQNSEMDVLWQLTETEECTIEWGLDDTYALGMEVTTEFSPDNQHRFTITDLVPGTTYYYRVTAVGGQYTGTFMAAPAATASNLKFFVYGDTRTYPLTHDWVVSEVVNTYTADSLYQTFILHVGDLVSDGDSEDDWNQEFFDPDLDNIREMMAHLPLQACMGNHEGSGTLFEKYFPYPYGLAAGRYWSFDYGPAHVVVVDQYTNYAPGSAQLAWIENDLAATDKTWKFMLYHDPGWSAGGHSNEIPVQLCLQPLCVEYGVSICFSGHNHYYARAVVDGVHHVTTGGGGAPLYSPNPDYPYVVATAEVNHFCKIDIDGSTLEFTAITPDGLDLDGFVIEDVTAVENEPFSLGQEKLAIFPNPFNPQTTISLSLGRTEWAEIGIYELTGKRVAVLADRAFTVGTHSVTWNGLDSQGRAMPSGTYIIRLETEAGVEARKVMLVR